jgi:hypothetical protein
MYVFRERERERERELTRQIPKSALVFLPPVKSMVEA